MESISIVYMMMVGDAASTNLPGSLSLAAQVEGVAFSFHVHQLAYLREVERSSTFTAAAERLGVSQPALSQALAALERQLGVSLFERAGRRRVLTEAGREAARFAGEVLGRAAELRSWVAARRQGDSGRLTVGMIDAASLYLLPGTIGAYRAAHPDVELQLLVDTSEELMDRLRRFELDLAFVIGPAGDDLEVHAVHTEALHIYAPLGASESPNEAAWALYPARSHTRSLIDDGLRRLGITPRVMLESSNPEVLRQVVALGLGWSVLPTAVAEGDAPVTLGEHRDADRRAQVAERTLLGVRRAGASPDARVEAFLRMALGT
ncbi:MAG: LysR family transcriptional regulator [Chloroflexota bacterium]